MNPALPDEVWEDRLRRYAAFGRFKDKKEKNMKPRKSSKWAAHYENITKCKKVYITMMLKGQKELGLFRCICGFHETRVTPTPTNRMWISPISSPIYSKNLHAEKRMRSYEEEPIIVVEPEVKPGPSGISKKKSKPLPVTSSSSSEEEDDGSTAMKKIPRSTNSNRRRRAKEIAENAKLGIKTKSRNVYGQFCKVCGESQQIHPYFAPYLGSRYCPTVNTNISWKDWKKEKKAAASNEN